MPKKKTKNLYWDSSIINAKIIEYLAEEDENKKNLIFENHLYQPLLKVSECLCNRFQMNSCGGDVQLNRIQQCTSHLSEILTKGKFDPAKGFNSFSYFSTCAKNWLSQANTKAYENENLIVMIDQDDNHDDNSHLWKEIVIDEDDLPSEKMEKLEFEQELYKYIIDHLDIMFVRKSSREIARKIIHFMQHDGSYVMTKWGYKGLLSHLRSITGEKTVLITKTIRKLHHVYAICKSSWIKNGIIPNDTLTMIKIKSFDSTALYYRNKMLRK